MTTGAGKTRTGLGAVMKQRRRERGYTLEDLATTCGCSITYIADIEYGTWLGDSVIPCIQDVLGIGDDDVDLHYYRFGRVAPDLEGRDESRVREALRAFRREVEE